MSRVSSALAGAVAVLLVAGCSGPVHVAVPQPEGDVATACRTLLSDVPATVDGRERQEVEPPSPYTAAWGSPAITLACGVEKPHGLNRASECLEINGVGWLEEVLERDGGHLFTTIGREAFVQVRVPNDYEPDQRVNPLVDLAAAINKDIPVVQPCV